MNISVFLFRFRQLELLAQISTVASRDLGKPVLLRLHLLQQKYVELIHVAVPPFLFEVADNQSEMLGKPVVTDYFFARISCRKGMAPPQWL